MSAERDLDKQKYWLDVIQRWQKSRLCQKEFCRQESLSYPKLYSWRRELTKRMLIEGAAACGNVKKPSGVVKAQTCFAPVEIKSMVEVREMSLERLEIVTPGGYVVRIP